VLLQDEFDQPLADLDPLLLEGAADLLDVDLSKGRTRRGFGQIPRRKGGWRGAWGWIRREK
jgi:hypothetical protein